MQQSRLGYYVGNKVIKNIASRLKDFLKPDEVLSRYAEDEFVYLIKGQHDHKKITTRAKKILDLISEPFHSI